MIFASRGSRGPDRHLDGKVRIFFLGGILALVGIRLDSSILVGLALLVLIGGVFLRLSTRTSSDGMEGDSPEGMDHEEIHPE